MPFFFVCFCWRCISKTETGGAVCPDATTVWSVPIWRLLQSQPMRYFPSRSPGLLVFLHTGCLLMWSWFMWLQCLQLTTASPVNTTVDLKCLADHRPQHERGHITAEVEDNCEKWHLGVFKWCSPGVVSIRNHANVARICLLMVNWANWWQNFQWELKQRKSSTFSALENTNPLFISFKPSALFS